MFNHTPFLLYCPDKNLKESVHFEHCEAINEYHGNPSNVIESSMLNIIRSLSRFKVLYIQKSSLSNIIILLLSRILGVYTILYVHEPLTLPQRIKKGVPFIKAATITLFHFFEVLLPNILFTGNPNNKVYRMRRLKFAPLLYTRTNNQNHWSARAEDILYFGRLDREKYFEDFEKLIVARKIVATSNLNITNSRYEVLHLSRHDKDAILSAHKYVWCVQKDNMTQSGVMIDALRSGCVLLVHESDPVTQFIHTSEYIPIPVPFDSGIVLNKISDYERRHALGPVGDSSFDNLAGSTAFEKYWRTLFNFEGAS